VIRVTPKRRGQDSRYQQVQLVFDNYHSDVLDQTQEYLSVLIHLCVDIYQEKWGDFNGMLFGGLNFS
jgi:hypothetical protein